MEFQHTTLITKIKKGRLMGHKNIRAQVKVSKSKKMDSMELDSLD
jgi:hypothetical protein